jgi:hypothetical protein
VSALELVPRRVVRREMDRIAGEILRSHERTDDCLELFARREKLRATLRRRDRAHVKRSR